MRILIVGSGGREHALAWKLSQEAEVFACPGNPGIADVCEVFDCKVGDTVGIAALADRLSIDLILYGPEDPLIAGAADVLRRKGFLVFGPGQDGARLEGSKAFAKQQMIRAGIPTAEFRSFDDPEAALNYARDRFQNGRQVAVKASGAALGKGVLLCAELSEAEDAIQAMLIDRELGLAGETIVIEDRLMGKEFSLMAIVGGPNFWCLPPVQDYKRIHDGDQGPNTGGMGSFSPVPWVSEPLLRRTETQVIAPMVQHLSTQCIDFRGMLFAGILVQNNEPYCLEYNVRWGDPETQSIVRRLGSGLAESLRCASEGRPIAPPEVLQNAAVSVVVASAGYPGAVKKGFALHLEPSQQDVLVFQAGTSSSGSELVTNGGRVLAVSSEAQTLEQARYLAYEGLQRVRFEGMQYRRDIAESPNH